MDRLTGALLALAVLGTGVAQADTLTPISNGGSLLASQSWMSSAGSTTPSIQNGTGVNGDGSGVIVSDLSAATTATYLFNQTFFAPSAATPASSTINGNPYGFTTSYVVNLPSSVSTNSFIFSLNLGSTTGLSDLTARLYFYTAGGAQNLALGGTGAISNGLIQDWTAGQGGTNIMLPATNLASSGEYVLEIAGLETGSTLGTFYGALNVAPAVPLPAALPLLASALGGLGWFRRRRRAV